MNGNDDPGSWPVRPQAAPPAPDPALPEGGAEPPFVPPGWAPAEGTTAAAQPSPPAVAPPTSPPKWRRRRWVVLGVVAALLGIGGFQLWQEEQAYRAGHTAYLAGDCAGAVESLRRAGGDDESASSDTDTEIAARAELQECEALLAAGDLNTQGKPADALLAYRDFIVEFPRSPLLATARSNALVLAAAAAAGATTAMCDELASLETMNLLGTPPSVLPQLLYE